MSTDYEGLRIEVGKIAPWVFPLVSTCSATGGTTQLTDIYQLTDSNSDVFSADTLTTMWIFRPDAGTATDRERRVGGNSGSALVTTTGFLYQGGTAWAVAPASAEQYEIHAIRPKTTFDILVRTMDEFYQATLVPISRFTDADMQTSGTTNYSISGAGSLSKVTTASNVHSGSQSLFLNAGTAGEYAESPSIRVQPGKQYFASSVFRVDAGTGSFAVWDKTNDVEIGTRLSHSLEAFMSVQRTFTAPTGCEEVSFRIYATGSADDIYIDCFHGPFKSDDGVMNAPSWLKRDSQFRKLLTADYLGQYASGVYDANTRRFDEILRRYYSLRVNSYAANPYKIEFRNTYLPMQELWVEGIRKASDVTTFAFTAAGETAPTTEIDKHTLALAWARNIARHVLSYRPDDDEAKATLGQCNDELEPLMQDYIFDLETPTYEPGHPLTYSVRG